MQAAHFLHAVIPGRRADSSLRNCALPSPLSLPGPVPGRAEGAIRGLTRQSMRQFANDRRKGIARGLSSWMRGSSPRMTPGRAARGCATPSPQSLPGKRREAPSSRLKTRQSMRQRRIDDRKDITRGFSSWMRGSSPRMTLGCMASKPGNDSGEVVRPRMTFVFLARALPSSRLS
jgi:hypothetical protein